MNYALITLSTLASLSLPAIAQSTTAPAPTAAQAPLPSCKEDDSNAPCRMKKSKAYAEVSDMMFDNRKGFNHIAKQAPGIKQNMTGGFRLEDVRVTLVKSEHLPRDEHRWYRWVTTLRYEVLLNDCRGTDACLGNYLWTVDAVTRSDGYTYDTQYNNKIEKSSLRQLDAEEKEEK